MAALDDEQIAGLLKAAFDAGRKMEQMVVDSVFDDAEKHGKGKLAALEQQATTAGLADEENQRLATLVGGLAAIASMRGRLEKRRNVEVESKVVRVSRMPNDGCGTCPDCLAEKPAEPVKAN